MMDMLKKINEMAADRDDCLTLIQEFAKYLTVRDEQMKNEIQLYDLGSKEREQKIAEWEQYAIVMDEFSVRAVDLTEKLRARMENAE